MFVSTSWWALHQQLDLTPSILLDIELECHIHNTYSCSKSQKQKLKIIFAVVTIFDVVLYKSGQFISFENNTNRLMLLKQFSLILLVVTYNCLYNNHLRWYYVENLVFWPHDLNPVKLSYSVHSFLCQVISRPRECMQTIRSFDMKLLYVTWFTSILPDQETCLLIDIIRSVDRFNFFHRREFLTSRTYI